MRDYIYFLPVGLYTHAAKVKSCQQSMCFFNCLLLNLHWVYAACLRKRRNKKKQPKQSALYKQALFCFPFPPVKLQQSCIYLDGFLITKHKGLRSSITFAWCDCIYVEIIYLSLKNAGLGFIPATFKLWLLLVTLGTSSDF